VDILIRKVRETERKSRLRRYQNNLWLLMTEVGGIGVVPTLISAKDGNRLPLLSESFHKPMLAEWDTLRVSREKCEGARNHLSLWPREFDKTVCLIWQTVQDYLNDLLATIVWWHAVEEKAEEACWHVSSILQHNKELRKLFPPGSIPSQSAKRFISATSFDLPANYGGKSSSFRAYGWTSEATGGHAKIGKLDDIVARGVIEDNLQRKQAAWYRNTVMNVVHATGWLDAAGTRWAMDDQYAIWMKSPNWTYTLRACLEKDGVPDKSGKPTFMAAELIDYKRTEMETEGNDFDPQMMNDPSPAGERPWVQDRETVVKKEEAAGPGLVVVLSDPAPKAIGGAGQTRHEMSGQKNSWANAVVKLRKRGLRSEIVLLDGSFSRAWDLDAGFSEVARLQRKWNARHVAIEKVGTAIAVYRQEWRRISRREGVPQSEIELTMTYKGKPARFGALCAKLVSGEFLICEESCNEEFLQVFYDQARNARFSADGKSLLRFDDCADAVSFSCDPVFARYAPTVDGGADWGPFVRAEPQAPSQGTRYVRW
jgi:hypothetical protein